MSDRKLIAAASPSLAIAILVFFIGNTLHSAPSPEIIKSADKKEWVAEQKGVLEQIKTSTVKVRNYQMNLDNLKLKPASNEKSIAEEKVKELLKLEENFLKKLRARNLKIESKIHAK